MPCPRDHPHDTSNGPGVTDHIWNIGELVDAALRPETPEPEGRRVGRFRVIDGGAK